MSEARLKSSRKDIKCYSPTLNIWGLEETCSSSIWWLWTFAWSNFSWCLHSQGMSGNFQCLSTSIATQLLLPFPHFVLCPLRSSEQIVHPSAHCLEVTDFWNLGTIIHEPLTLAIWMPKESVPLTQHQSFLPAQDAGWSSWSTVLTASIPLKLNLGMHPPSSATETRGPRGSLGFVTLLLAWCLFPNSSE